MWRLPLLLVGLALTPAHAAENPRATPHCAQTSIWKGGCEHVEMTLPVLQYSRVLRNGLITALERFGEYFNIEQLAVLRTTEKLMKATLRAGMVEERLGEGQTCKGTVIFLQGFGASMQNHVPLFTAMAAEGYRVVTFDYMGQGGSKGDMDKMRIENIPWAAEEIYQLYAKREERRCAKKIVMGWSSGGIAAWYWTANQAHPRVAKVDNKDIDAVILLNPSIAARLIPGETRLPNSFGKFTFPSLAGLEPESDERKAIWIDPIFPDTAFVTPTLGISLLINGKVARTSSTFPDKLKGLVIVGGSGDVYIDNDKIWSELPAIAPGPNFEHKRYDTPFHSLDNARSEVREATLRDVVDFLKRL